MELSKAFLEAPVTSLRDLFRNHLAEECPQALTTIAMHVAQGTKARMIMFALAPTPSPRMIPNVMTKINMTG